MLDCQHFILFITFIIVGVCVGVGVIVITTQDHQTQSLCGGDGETNTTSTDAG